jgi:hypothetical protein
LTITYTEIENRIIQWIKRTLIICNISAAVIKANQNGPRPSLPYINMNVTTITKVGQAETPTSTDEFGVGDIKYNEDSSVSLQGFGKGSNDILQALKNSLQKEDTRQYLNSCGLVIRDDSSITDISLLIDATIEKRYLLEIMFGWGQSDTDTVGFIENVVIDENYLPPQ